MSVYPFELDNDESLNPFDDNITEIRSEQLNQLRDAIFNIEEELGIKPSGSQNTVVDRLDVSLNDDGSIKTSALASAGLVTLPIDDAQVGSMAGIKESKLNLDYNTSSLKLWIDNNENAINVFSAQLATANNNFSLHIAGGDFRHVGSQIDINTPGDPRDPSFTGQLFDRDGNVRSATEVGTALIQINDDLIGHLNQAVVAHAASEISVDTTNLLEIPSDANDVQKAIEALDASDNLKLGTHRQIMHSNGVPRKAFSNSFVYDGYGDLVLEPTSVEVFSSHPPNSAPIDEVAIGDDIIKFNAPINLAENLKFQSQFSQVVPGDHIVVNYGSFSYEFKIITVRNVVDSGYYVRIAGFNPVDGEATASIYRPNYTDNTYSVLAVAPVNPTPVPDLYGTQLLGSLIIADPRAASVLGLGFIPDGLTGSRYNLYLNLYPTGNPEDGVIELPAIDVTGNQGTTVGKYDIHSVVKSTNDGFRAAGYNYRFIAFEKDGNFGISLADSIDGVGFSIRNESSLLNNVVGGNDPLGLGAGRANVASRNYNTVADSTDAQTPTKIFLPNTRKYYSVGGVRTDRLAEGFETTDGYWTGQLASINVLPNTIEATYEVSGRLDGSGLFPGRTITVAQMSGGLNTDYGRFIIKDVNYESCPGFLDVTKITVLNAVHGAGNPVGATTNPAVDGYLDVKLYFGADSVPINIQSATDCTSSGLPDYHRLLEIYIDANQQTFSYERARFKVSSGTTSLLNTVPWSILNVSSKFKGYVQTSGGLTRRFVRLTITYYSQSLQKYTAYLSDLSGTILGPTATFKKGQVARFYDNTYNDYIELKYEEDSTVSPGKDIIANRYVDIEIFPTIATNQEVYKLATCQVIWEPETSPLQYIVNNVIDRREFGNVSEQDLTESAKDFIRAINKYTTSNGAIQGFVVNGGTTDINVSGGIAIVDGKVVNANSVEYKVPDIDGIHEVILCLNESGNYESFIIGDGLDASYLTDDVSGNTYFKASTKVFYGIVNTRKDLLPIVSYTCTNGNASDFIDVLRFIDETCYNKFSWFVDFSAGSFRSKECLSYWVKNHDRINEIEAFGSVDINEYLNLNLNPLKKIRIFGQASFNLSRSANNTCIQFDCSNITFNGLTFNYTVTGDGGYNVNDKFWASKSGAAVKFTTFNNIDIIGCNFIATGNTAPLLMITGDVERSSIKSCKFNCSKTAICILKKDDLEIDTLLINNNNIIGQIFIGGLDGVPSILCQGLEISSNTCDVINVSTLGTIDTNRVEIRNNNAKLISNALNVLYDVTSKHYSESPIYRASTPGANINVVGNFVNGIIMISKIDNPSNAISVNNNNIIIDESAYSQYTNLSENFGIRCKGFKTFDTFTVNYNQIYEGTSSDTKGIVINDCYSAIICGNTVNVGQIGVYTTNCEKVTIDHNLLDATSYCIRVINDSNDSSKFGIKGNHLTGTMRGVEVSKGRGDIIGNTISFSQKTAISMLDSASRCIISNNDIKVTPLPTIGSPVVGYILHEGDGLIDGNFLGNGTLDGTETNSENAIIATGGAVILRNINHRRLWVGVLGNQITSYLDMRDNGRSANSFVNWNAETDNILKGISTNAYTNAFGSNAFNRAFTVLNLRGSSVQESEAIRLGLTFSDLKNYIDIIKISFYYITLEGQSLDPVVIEGELNYTLQQLNNSSSTSLASGSISFSGVSSNGSIIIDPTSNYVDAERGKSVYLDLSFKGLRTAPGTIVPKIVLYGLTFKYKY